jgi:hypothetical protein
MIRATSVCAVVEYFLSEYALDVDLPSSTVGA